MTAEQIAAVIYKDQPDMQAKYIAARNYVERHRQKAGRVVIGKRAEPERMVPRTMREAGMA